MKKMKGEFLLLSSLIPDEEFNRLMLLDKNPQMATHLFYWKFYNGIKKSELSENNFYLISTRPITEYPTCKIKYVKSKTWKTSEGNIHELFFINYPIIKILTVFFSCIFQGLKWGMSTNNKLKRAIIVDSTVPYLLTGYFLSKIYKVPLFGIMTDPPNMQYKITWESSFKSKFRKLNAGLMNLLLKKLTGVIALTKGLVDKYCPGIENLIIEGIIDFNEGEADKKIIKKNDNFIILYSGSLARVYGILELIKAFTKLPFMDAELWLFGKGDVEKEIIEFEKKDVRIKYFGFFKNSKIKEYQQLASLLVNPRPTNLPDANYSFPSKILEYLQSGTPTLLSKLPGIPSEYNDYAFFLNGFDEDSIREKIKELYFMERSELITFGQRAKIFAESKNTKNQGNKIGNFISEVTKNYFNNKKF